MRYGDKDANLRGREIGCGWRGVSIGLRIMCDSRTEHVPNRALSGIDRCVARIVGVMVMVPAAGQRLHDLGRHALRAQFEQQAAARGRRHVSVWRQGTKRQQCERRCQDDVPVSIETVHVTFDTSRTSSRRHWPKGQSGYFLPLNQGFEVVETLHYVIRFEAFLFALEIDRQNFGKAVNDPGGIIATALQSRVKPSQFVHDMGQDAHTGLVAGRQRQAGEVR